MRSRRRSASAERISLFPFIAVLICTMGALLVLLVLMSQHAQATASARQNEVSAEEQTRRQYKLDDLQASIDEWQQIRAGTREAVDRRRAELAHLEDHMRRIRARLDEIKASRAELATRQPADANERARLARELQELEQALAEANQKLAEAEDRAASEVSYSIVPYNGPHETRRRPIYLECRADSVVLQPEGIHLVERDFLPPLDASNPLVAALRAASTHWSRTGASPETPGRPYPLLLVRPEGISAYYAARRAMKSWETDFGYELIGEDWPLEFPAADPRLARSAQQAVDAARRRRSQRGGLGGGFGNGRGFGRGSQPGGDADEPAQGRRRGFSSFGFGDGGEDGENDARGDAERGSSRPEGSPWNRAGDAAGSGGSYGEQGGPSRDRPQGQPGGRPGGRSGTAASPTSGASGGAGAVESLAETRGKNWASPNASRGLIAFTRTMRVQVAGDRLLILPADNNLPPAVVALPGSTRDAVEEFVSQVWEEIESWGSAGRGSYWRPAIQLQILPGGAARARDLEVLLRDSGLDIEPPL